MKWKTSFVLVFGGLAVAGPGTAAATAQEAQVKAQDDRTKLPIEGPWYPPITTPDARDAKDIDLWIDLDSLLAIKTAIDHPRYQEDARILRAVRDRRKPR